MISHENPFHVRLRTAVFWLGVVLLVPGIGAVSFPIVSTLVATVFNGWILLISGIVALAGSVSFHGAGSFSVRFGPTSYPSQWLRFC
jgi:uncharacterized membrane protein HdeD (DUF308 family)